MTDIGLTERELTKIHRELGTGALAKVKENPYILSRLFKLQVVDGVARRLGVASAKNIHRAVAIAEYELDRALQDGHCFVHTHTLLAKARLDCKLTNDQFTHEELALHGTIVVEGKSAMLRAIYDAETYTAEQIKELAARVVGAPDHAEFADTVELDVDSDQTTAVQLMLSAGVGVVTGAPGTGKTTSMTRVLDVLDAQHLPYALCAPTGKAAKRIAEVTGRPATTIHRLLGWTHEGFTFNAGCTLSHSVVIVDESSMIDIQLVSSLLAAINPLHTRVIFIGDANQLPPVGPGAFFNDLISSGVVPVVWLQTLHRAAAGSWIYRNAPKILVGRDVELETDVPDFTWYETRTDQPQAIKEAAANVIKQLFDEGATWDEFQLLAPMRIKQGGAIELNAVLQEQFLKVTGARAEIGYRDEDGTSTWVSRGDRVIQTKNDYDLDVFNGETGEVALVESPSRVRVRFDGEYRIYKGAALKNLALSYALTIHKYQGSQALTVIVVCHSVHGRMLNRRLFYTAVTRARTRVIVIGDEKGVMQAINSTQDMSRRTQLAARIKGQL